MDEGLIRNWNAFVGTEDEIFILGDVFFCGKTRAKEIMKRLNGKKFLISGNHDWGKIPTHRCLEFGFEWIKTHDWVTIGGQEVALSHFPYIGDHTSFDRFLEYRIADKGLPLLHGHVHTIWRQRERMINVGVDVWGWCPVAESCLEQLIKGMKLGEANEIQGSDQPGDGVERPLIP
jgi:calcineurin-like phosphoesterase family protein